MGAVPEEEEHAPLVRTPVPSLVVQQVRPGRSVAEVAANLELSEGTVFRWLRQDRIDRGELEGTSTVESADLRAAKSRIAEVESELATVKRASELFDKGRVVRPKRPLRHGERGQ